MQYKGRENEVTLQNC